MANANLDKISVNVDITLTLDLPPETAKIVSSIRVGDRTFFPFETLADGMVAEIESATAKLKVNKPRSKTAAKAGTKASTKPGKPEKIPCALPECGVMFVPKNVRSRFHSPQCAQKAYQKTWQDKKKAAAKTTTAHRRTTKAAAKFGAAGAASDTPIGKRPLTIGDTPTRLPASMGRQGD